MIGLRYDRADVWQPVVELWDLVLANPIHSPFCSCLLPRNVALDGDTVEQDLLDYLAPRYRDSRQMQLAAILEKRAMAARSGFIDWLREATRNVPDQDKARLIDDLVETLSSIREASSGGFVCR